MSLNQSFISVNNTTVFAKIVVEALCALFEATPSFLYQFEGVMPTRMLNQGPNEV